MVSKDPSFKAPLPGFFFPAALEATMTVGYFDLIGTLSRFPDGLRLLQSSNCLALMHRLAETCLHESAIALLVNKLDCAEYVVYAYADVRGVSTKR